MRKFVVTPGEFGPTFIEVDDDSYIVFVDEDDCPPEHELAYSQGNSNVITSWDTFMEQAPDNTRVSIADVKELWSE